MYICYFFFFAVVLCIYGLSTQQTVIVDGYACRSLAMRSMLYNVLCRRVSDLNSALLHCQETGARYYYRAKNASTSQARRTYANTIEVMQEIAVAGSGGGVWWSMAAGGWLAKVVGTHPAIHQLTHKGKYVHMHNYILCSSATADIEIESAHSRRDYKNNWLLHHGWQTKKHFYIASINIIVWNFFLFFSQISNFSNNECGFEFAKYFINASL